MPHCEDVKKDRAIGEFWERQFCNLAWKYGKCFTPLQWNRTDSATAWCERYGRHPLTLPDITIWTAPGQHHEIKHKQPTKHGGIGLEKYRFDALKWFWEDTHQDVFYTIHRHDLNGGRDNENNDISHWFTVNVAKLNSLVSQGKFIVGNHSKSYVGGEARVTPIYYWDISFWVPLVELFDPIRPSIETRTTQGVFF